MGSTTALGSSFLPGFLVLSKHGVCLGLFELLLLFLLQFALLLFLLLAHLLERLVKLGAYILQVFFGLFL